MFTVADVIFPAFFFPYAMVLLFPVAGIALLATEFGVYRWWFEGLTNARIVSIVLSSNVVSSILGIIAAAAMPSGLQTNWRPDHGDIHERIWSTYAAWSWPFAWAISVVAEFLFIWAVFRQDSLRRLFPGVLLANTASYAALFLIGIGASRLA